MKTSLRLFLIWCLVIVTTISAPAQMNVQISRPPSLIQEHLVAQWSFGEGFSQQVFNRVGTVSPHSPHLLTPQEQSFADRWSLVGFTITEQFAANSLNGDVTASRAVASGAGSRITAGSIALVAGTYTQSIYMKSNTGSSQTARFSYFDGTTHFSPDQTVTTSWQRFTWTFTSSATMSAFSCVTMDAANDALDLVIYGTQLEVGSSATTYTPAHMDFGLGLLLSPDSADPTWNTTGLNFDSANSQYGFAITSAPLSFSTTSVYLVFKQTGDGNFPAYAAGIGVDFAEGGKFNLNPRNNGATAFLFSGATSNAYAAYVNDNTWHVLTGTYDGTTLSTYVDDQVLDQTNAPGLSSVSVRKLFAGTYGITFLKGALGYAAFYDVAHNATQVKQQVASLQGIMACRGVVMKNLDQLIVYDGDSITNPAAFYGGPSWWNITQASLTPSMQGRDFAQSGNTLTELTARASQIDAMYNPARRLNLLVVAVGTNDLNAVSPATYFANLKTYCDARKAVGWKILVQTIIDRNIPGFYANKTTANNLILAEPLGTHWDGVIDWGSDPQIGCNGCSTTSFFIDGTHPDATVAGGHNGHGVMATYAIPKIQSVRP